MVLELRARARLPGFAKVRDDRREERGRTRGQVAIDGLEGRHDAGPGLLRIQQAGVDRLEEGGVERHRPRDDFAVRHHARADDFDLGERRRRVEDPERGVVEVPARDEPLVRLVDGGERCRGRAQELDLLVARAELVQPFAQPGDRLVVRVQQPPLGEQRVHERVLDGSLDRPPELGARDQERMHVDPIGVERDRAAWRRCCRRSSRAAGRCRTSPRRYRATGCRTAGRPGCCDPACTCATRVSSAAVNACRVDW